MSASSELRTAAHLALCCSDPGTKIALLRALADGVHDIDPALALPGVVDPGRPALPLLVPPARVPKRRLGTAAGRAALIHAIAHIEFNAINLALDAVARYAHLPVSYYQDWFAVAVEESLHFSMLVEHLAGMGHAYGDWPAHDGLWEAARKTVHDPLARMALVPRVLEARGLDVTPGMRARLAAAGDERAAEILDRILRDEIGHVAVGNRWFYYLCAERGCEPHATFIELCAALGQQLPRPPFNTDARLAGGFSALELAALSAAEPALSER